VGVVPEEANGGADHGAAENGEFGDEGHALEFQVVGEDDVATDVGEDGEGAGGDDGAADGETVEAVGEGDGVGGAHRDEDDKTGEGPEGQQFEMGDRGGPVVPLQRGMEELEEWNTELC